MLLKALETVNPLFNILFKIQLFCFFQSTRKISKIPFKVLDAPELQVCSCRYFQQQGLCIYVVGAFYYLLTTHMFRSSLDGVANGNVLIRMYPLLD